LFSARYQEQRDGCARCTATRRLRAFLHDVSYLLVQPLAGAWLQGKVEFRVVVQDVVNVFPGVSGTRHFLQYPLRGPIAAHGASLAVSGFTEHR
jgi:hypothetical protein